jgi:hypothetical protein
MFETCGNYVEIVSSFNEEFKYKVLEAPKVVFCVEINHSYMSWLLRVMLG